MVDSRVRLRHYIHCEVGYTVEVRERGGGNESERGKREFEGSERERGGSKRERGGSESERGREREFVGSVSKLPLTYSN